MAESALQTTVKPVEQPLNLIPVGLKEAALDSPTFRATALHFGDQIEIIERWLDGYIKAAAKLLADVSSLEASVNSFLTQSAPPANVSEAVIDHDYTLLAMRRCGEGAREFWNQTFRGVKKYENTVIEPIRSFLNNELRAFKDVRRTLDTNQKSFDAVVARYLSQSKSKEASSLREDAFQVHEARKAYLKASMDFCVSAPQLRATLDQVIVRVFAEQWKDMRNSRDASSATFAKLNTEMERVRGWSKEMENSERAFKRELMTARRQIEESAANMKKPSREIGDYELHTVPFLGTASTAVEKAGGQDKGEKQGWLLMKTVVGKPAKTVWSRRWFFVKYGIFGWLVQGIKSGGVEESEKIGVLLCGIRPAFQEERRFCFEVKTKDQSIILQAETQTELSEWISSFEFAKRKALEDPSSTEAPSASTGVDPAFAVSPPIAPEFAAKVDHADGRSEEAPAVLGVPERAETGPGALQRGSFDVTANRRVMSLGGEAGEGNRDHASRIMGKLDLHKRGSATPQLSQAPPPAGGIASLISASHTIMPIGPGSPANASSDGTSGIAVHKRNLTIPTSTLAPNTLASPPAPTNLSHTAVVVSGERSISLGSRSDGSGMPSGIMANLWGSSNWGYVNRLGDEIPKPQQHERNVSQASTPGLFRPTSIDDSVIMDGTGELSKNMPPSPDTGLGLRKALGSMPAAATEMNLPSQVARAPAEEKDEYPNYYPLPLKAQHGQFRILFPSVPRAQKVVLVFRATWNPNEQQEFPGRVYVTEKDVFFYSHHLGLVLITGVGLTSISEVTAAPGRDCDFLYLHLKEGVRQGDRRRITIRVFLDPLRLLRRRLSFLIHNANSDDPVNLEEVLKTLIKMEIEKPERSSSVESWDDLDDDDDDATPGDDNSPQRRRERNVKASLRIDGNLYGESARTGREVQKFHLPKQPVVYAPQGMQHSIAREFNVSAKALFHVIFGDKSAVFQLLYSNRWNVQIVQSPWTKDDGVHFTRQFANQGRTTLMSDKQTIDILNDHLCYVVTNSKHPGRLPYADRFHLTTKLVITHIAKSRCKLGVFQQINWHSAPTWSYIKHLLEKQAFNHLEADALDLTNVAMDQVAKLGNHSKTNKAIDIFGNVGQQSNVPQVTADAVPNLITSGRKQAKPVSLLKLVVADVMVRIISALTMALDLLLAIGNGAMTICTTHTLLVALLAFSALYNSWYGYRDGVSWWHERSATRYMARIGVKPEPTISRSIYLSDIEDLVVPTVNETVTSYFLPTAEAGSKTCRTTFGDQLISSTSVVGTGDRMHRSRDALAKYRHDLLVALRVVNRIERDVVVAEWEGWVRAEDRRCSKVQDMLQSRRPRKDKKSRGTERIDLATELGTGFAEYCESCRFELDAFANGTSLI